MSEEPAWGFRHDSVGSHGIGKVEDLESTLLFLVDPRSRFVNGAIVPVDDGLTVA